MIAVIDMKYAKRKIKCNCGHYAKNHVFKEGCCYECGCTWYWPNDKWLKKQLNENYDRVC